ncbi:MAG: BrnA antitoxin family protein [Desulfobulbus sp.]|nr:BrnA antitoxin family protein [Desulfobulbus sp.]
MSKPKKPDAEMLQFMAELEQGLKEALAGEGRVTTGAEIVRRTGGRPPLTVHKQPVTLRLEPDSLARWRASGKGWQTRAAALLAANAP